MRSQGVTVSVLVLAVIAASCGGSGGQGGSGPFELSESDLAAAESYFAPIDAEEDAFDELQASGDTSADAIRAFVESVYSPDVVFHDAALGDHREGHEAVIRMYQDVLTAFGDAVVEDTPTLVGDPTALQVIPFWDMALGPFAFTEDDPLIEVDLIEIDDDRLGTLLLFYDVASLRRLVGDRPVFDGSLQEDYAEAWSSGAIESVTALYAGGANRHDGLAGVDATGGEAIAAEADRWFTALPGAAWSVQLAFAESLGDQAGGVFDVTHDGCTVVVGILFDLDDGRITRERLHYDPAALRACGWVN